jgi:hypothetical protein
VKKQLAPRHVTVTHPAPVAPARTYTPPAVSTPQAPVRSTPRVKAQTKPVRGHRKRPVHAKPAPISLAPLADIVAAVRAPLPSAVDDEPPFRLLAGISLAVLAVAGSGLLLVSLRAFRTGWE